MYIKSVVLEGFKSYGRRTEVIGFDPEFTAITGLNGTGKSNILDSICFVLGITNLGQVRASSLQDLVYKSGQAGVTKASVTLIFDNSDPSQCPLGYEKCREISVTRIVAVGGKNKYLINGKLVPNKKVSDLFCSVQLNVNNPNFLIMQGRITKVLNMKPAEILSMIEEAAGTSMYETKREATTKLIEKKDAKVRETNILLQEEVEPKLEKLREERASFLSYQKLVREIDYLTRINVSYRYTRLKKSVESIEANIERLGNHVDTCKETIKKNDDECSQIDEKCKVLQTEIDGISGGALKQLEKELNDHLSSESSVKGNLKESMSQVQKAEKELKSIEKSKIDDENILSTKERELAKVKDLFESLRTAEADDAKAYEVAQSKLEAVNKGLSTDEEGKATTLQEQLTLAKQKMSAAQTTLKTASNEMKHLRNVLKQKENETQTSDAAYMKDKSIHDNIEKDIRTIQQKLKATNYREGSFENLQERRSKLQEEIRKLNRQLEERHAYRYMLQYSDPEPNFDRSKVRGMVGKLFTVRDPSACLALMMTAGGSLYSYVTDDDITSKKILQRGQLKQRVTIIPINKISSRPIEQSVVNIAQKLVGKQNVQSALSLIEYDQRYDPVMKFVFGHTLICRDLNIAKQVTYNRDIFCRSVTLEGDVVDPEGTLSGGSRPKGANILEELSAINHIESEIKSRKLELQQLEREISALKTTAEAYNLIKKKLDERALELQACKESLARSDIQQHQKEIELLKERIQGLEEELIKAKETDKSSKVKVKDIEDKLADAEGYRERQLQAANDEVKAAKKKADESRKNWQKHEQQFNTVQLEIEELRKGIESQNEQFNESAKLLEKLRAEVEKCQETCANLTEQVNNKKREIKEQKDAINTQNKELKNLLVKSEKLQKQNQELIVEIKKKENESNRIRNENTDSLKQIANMEKNYTWIGEDREYFGMKNTRYDYSKEDPTKSSQKLANLQAKKEKLERQINHRAMVLLEREEEQYQETMRRKKIVEEDKEKIKHIITKMDEKKREKVDKAWSIVNDNFSSIFSTLLQGAQACLNPVKVSNELTGLEIKVGFNNVWKESLGELSGGQRSLVALSLVLAMLKFCPAPLYILDEVDAALDMSHTQNIGNMLKAHFTSSQFIIVSLKDGMFNNANVLFRTKFEEGVSAVTRVDNRKMPVNHKK